MNIHEYQGKALLRDYGVAVLDGAVAFTPEDAVAAAEKLGGPVYVVKSQIHAGGRGAGHFVNDPERATGGGVRVVKSVEAVEEAARFMLGNTLVTKQTGPEGKEVKRLYVEAGCDIARELYLSLLVDRATSRVTIVASTEGGMDIETVAEETPEKIMQVDIDPATGIQGHHARSIAFGLGLEGAQVKSATRFLMGLYKAFIDLDCAMVEINPLVVTGDGELLALDAKVGFDDNALFRHKALDELRDEDEEDASEREAAAWDLNYVKLDGEIGCMVNGAGLAMATMAHQALRLRACELPRCRRRRHRRTGDGGLQNHPVRPQREGHSRQHFRWDHEVRHHRQRCGRSGARDQPFRAAGGPARRHQRREGQGDHGRLRA